MKLSIRHLPFSAGYTAAKAETTIVKKTTKTLMILSNFMFADVVGWDLDLCLVQNRNKFFIYFTRPDKKPLSFVSRDGRKLVATKNVLWFFGSAPALDFRRVINKNGN
jgi:hypothetical protein